MSAKILLWGLIPYAGLLAWSIRKLKLGALSTALLCVVTVGVVWGVLYASFSLAPSDPSLAFSSVETISREVSYEWRLRYAAEVFGWLVGLLYFWACWGAARFWSSRQSHTT